MEGRWSLERAESPRSSIRRNNVKGQPQRGRGMALSSSACYSNAFSTREKRLLIVIPPSGCPWQAVDGEVPALIKETPYGRGWEWSGL